MPTPRSLVAALFLTLLVPTVSAASEGVLEINQTCAVQTGCFPGDGAGFPVTIDQSGSYRLTSDLTVTVVADAIRIGDTATPESVTLDLGGFVLHGPVVCAALNCTGNAGRGVFVESAGRYVIRRGHVEGFSVGIEAVEAADGLIEDVRAMRNRFGGIRSFHVVRKSEASWNGGDGISFAHAVDSLAEVNAGDGFVGGSATNTRSLRNLGAGYDGVSPIRGCHAFDNGGDGIRSAVVVQDCQVNVNDGVGIRGGSLLRVTASSVFVNGGRGIVASDGAHVAGCSVRNNGDHGIQVEEGALVRDTVSSENSGHGIVYGAGSLVRDNTVRGNSAFGFVVLGTGSSYRGNTISANGDGTIFLPSGAVTLNTGANICNNSFSCP